MNISGEVVIWKLVLLIQAYTLALLLYLMVISERGDFYLSCNTCALLSCVMCFVLMAL